MEDEVMLVVSKKFLVGLLAVGVIFSVASTQINAEVGGTITRSGVVTEEQKEEKIDTVVLGTSLSKVEQEAMKAVFKEKGADVGKGAKVYKSNGNDLMAYLDASLFTPTWKVYSSVYVVGDEAANGVDVEILTPMNITITEDQYRNAAITAGLSNVKIYVASPVKIDGSGALAGVYVAAREAGVEVNKERSKLANQELTVTDALAQQLDGQEGFSKEKLSDAIEAAKVELAEQAKDGQKLTDEAIDKAVREALDKAGLGGIMKPEQVKQVVLVFINLNKADVFKDLANEFDFNQLKDQLSEKGIELGGNIWTSISNWFSGVFNWFGGLFNGSEKVE